MPQPEVPRPDESLPGRAWSGPEAPEEGVPTGGVLAAPHPDAAPFWPAPFWAVPFCPAPFGPAPFWPAPCPLAPAPTRAGSRRSSSGGHGSPRSTATSRRGLVGGRGGGAGAPPTLS